MADTALKYAFSGTEYGFCEVPRIKGRHQDWCLGGIRTIGSNHCFNDVFEIE